MKDKIKEIPLYHYTRNKNLKSIFIEGLKPNKLGVVYLCPTLEEAEKVIASTEYENIIEVDVSGYKLTAFDDCREWEILCWANTPIPPDRLMLIQFKGV